MKKLLLNRKLYTQQNNQEKRKKLFTPLTNSFGLRTKQKVLNLLWILEVGKYIIVRFIIDKYKMSIHKMYFI